MRTKDEIILESVWNNKVLLSERSIFSRFFSPDDTPQGEGKLLRALKRIHLGLGITADAKPIPIEKVDIATAKAADPRSPNRSVDQKIKSEFDPKGLGKKTDFGYRGSGIKKHEVVANVLKRGDGVFVINPQTKTRLFIKRPLGEQDQKPDKRFLKHGRGDRYDVWVFGEDGKFIHKNTRPLTGGYGEKKPRSELESNIYSYIDRQGSIFVIPNESWRGTPDSRQVFDADPNDPTQGEFSDQARVRGSEPSVNRFNDDEVRDPSDSPMQAAAKASLRRGRMQDEQGRITKGIQQKTADSQFQFAKSSQRNPTAIASNIEGLSDGIIDKYGKYIQKRFNAATEPLKDKIKVAIDNGDISPEMMQNLMDELFAFREIAKSGPKRDLVNRELQGFLATIKDWKQYDMDTGRGFVAGEGDDLGRQGTEATFNTQEGMTRFLRDLVKHMLRDVHGAKFEQEVYDAMDMF